MTKKISEIDLLKAMNEIPDEWVESCYEKNDIEIKPAKHEKRTRENYFAKIAIKWAAAATAVILLCGCGVAYAASLGVFQFVKIDNKTSHGFSLTVETERIAADEFIGDIHEVEGFLRAYMTEENYRQQFPSWIKRFEIVEDARAYIGYSAMKATKVPGVTTEVIVRVIGDTEGNLGEVSLFVRAEEGDIFINETSAVFTEECPILLHGTGILYLDSLEEKIGYLPKYRSKEYTTKSGKNVIFVYEDRSVGDCWAVAALVHGPVYYELSIHYKPQNAEQVKEMLIQWCEQF